MQKISLIIGLGKTEIDLIAYMLETFLDKKICKKEELEAIVKYW